MRRLMLCLALLGAACGNNTTETDTAITTPSPAGQTGAQKCQERAIPAPPRVADNKTKPNVEIPDGAPPCTLVAQDLKVGTGATAKAGGTVTVQYVGVSWSTKEQFDSSWDRGQPATFPLGQVVAGWREGIPGMREGGRRRLIIPPELAYGSEGRPPAIAPNETLVFVIDMIKAA